jgi:hypothetical protein
MSTLDSTKDDLKYTLTKEDIDCLANLSGWHVVLKVDTLPDVGADQADERRQISEATTWELCSRFPKTRTFLSPLLFSVKPATDSKHGNSLLHGPTCIQRCKMSVIISNDEFQYEGRCTTFM